MVGLIVLLAGLVAMLASLGGFGAGARRSSAERTTETERFVGVNPDPPWEAETDRIPISHVLEIVASPFSIHLLRASLGPNGRPRLSPVLVPEQLIPMIWLRSGECTTWRT